MNNPFTLDHELSPPALRELNHELIELLSLESLDEARFRQLVSQRDSIIRLYLEECEEPQRKLFAAAELKVNGALVAYASQLFKTSLNQLSGLIRGRKAVKKYI